MRSRHLFYLILSLACVTSACLFFITASNSEQIGNKRNIGFSRLVEIRNLETGVTSSGPRQSKASKHGDSVVLPNPGKNAEEYSPVAEIGGILVYPDIFQPDYTRDTSELYDRVVPNNVFFVWCGRRTFEFQHYLSILSVWYHLEPDVIEIRYDEPPLEDKYNVWLSKLRSHIPVLNLQSLPEYALGDICGPSFGLELVLDRGGVFVNDGVILYGKSPSSLNFLLTQKARMSFFKDKTIAWVAAIKKSSEIKRYLDTFVTSGMHSETTFKRLSSTLFNNTDIWISNCASALTVESHADRPTVDESFNNKSKPFLNSNDVNENCIRFQKSPHPVDFMKSKNIKISSLDNLKSLIFEKSSFVYNMNKSETHAELKTNKKPPIPSIIHYVWFGRKTLSFSMYLSFLSSVNIVRPSAVLIHSDLVLEGSYWAKIRQNPLVHLVYREAPRTIFGHRVLYTQHRSDVVRADILTKYGGIYLDWDAFWVKPLDTLLNSQEDVILSRDHIPRHPFPDTINMGVVLARPRSTFIQRWRAALVNYKSNDFLYNAVELPYKIYESYPQSVFLNDRLQVICYFLKCHPAFHPRFKNWGESQPFNWMTDVHALHFTHPDPPAFHNESALQETHGTFSDVGKYIMLYSKSPQSRLEDTVQ